VTHHIYPGIGRASFNSPQALDAAHGEIVWYANTIRSLAPGSQIWAGEDGPIGGGNSGTCGSNSVCGTYASALWYADDLSNRARHGFVQYQRQAFVGGAYGLTASANDHPQSALGPTEALLLRPGYWTNFLWKRTLGQSVFNATSSSQIVRAYAYAGIAPSPFAAKECIAADSWQLLLINLSPTDNATTTFQAAHAYSAWSLAPVVNASGALDPFSTRVMLNGVLLPDLVGAASGTASGRGERENESDAGPSFLQNIPVAAAIGAVTGGLATVELGPLSITFLCVA
jgi:hypothetical protein